MENLVVFDAYIYIGSRRQMCGVLRPQVFKGPYYIERAVGLTNNLFVCLFVCSCSKGSMSSAYCPP